MNTYIINLSGISNIEYYCIVAHTKNEALELFNREHIIRPANIKNIIQVPTGIIYTIIDYDNLNYEGQY